MKRLSLTLFLGFLFLSTTGASGFDKETKQSVSDVTGKIDQIQEQEKNYHFQESKQIAEISDQLNVTTGQLNEALQEIRELKTFVTSFKPQSLTETSSLPKTLPEPIATATVPDNIQFQLKNARYESWIGIIFSTISIFLMLFVLTRTQKEQNLPQQIVMPKKEVDVDVEVENTEEDFVHKRPLLKIQSHGESLSLVNSGDASADEVRVFLGTAPTTMREKLKTAAKIQAGEKMPLDLPMSLREESLYATLEYKNPHSGRVYKDQFILRADSLTGHTTSHHALS